MSGAEGPRPPGPGAPGMPPAPVAPPQAPVAMAPPPGGMPYRGPAHGYGPDLVGGRQNGERARKALWVGLVAFSVQAVCSVVVLASLSDFYREILDAVGSGRTLTRAQSTPPTDPTYLVASALSQLAGIGVLIVGILFLIWFHKALSNARALGVPLTRSPGWGVAGFFVPIVNFWFPYQAMRDLIPAGHEARPLVGRWWACYLGASFMTSAAGVAALVAPVVGITLALVVVVLYVIAAITLRELISASTQVAEAIARTTPPTPMGWGTPAGPAPAPPTFAAPAPGGPSAGPGPTNGASAGWAPSAPADPPKDPWNRS